MQQIINSAHLFKGNYPEDARYIISCAISHSRMSQKQATTKPEKNCISHSLIFGSMTKFVSRYYQPDCLFRNFHERTKK
jgi:hypothetical protein